MPRTIAFFDGSTSATGGELWETDGTAAGSVLVADIVPGPGSSYPSNLTPTGAGTVVFTANDGGPNGPELFALNGRAAGTVELNSGFVQVVVSARFPLYVSPSNFTPLGNGRVLFTDPTSPASLQVWSTDGTVAGTQLVKDLAGAGATSNSVTVEALGSGRAVFQVRAGDAAGLWSTDGTAGGTAQLLSLQTTPVGALGNGQGLFTTGDNAGGSVLAVTNGTAAGTGGIYDFSGGYRGNTVAIGGGRALFAASDGLALSELWVTDGTATGTVKLAGGAASGLSTNTDFAPHNITSLGNGQFVFSANNGRGDAAVWVTDGTVAGTVSIEDLGQSDPNYSITGITALGGGKALLEVTYKGNYGSALLVTDGTAAGTAVLGKFAPAEQYLSALGSIAALPGSVAVFAVSEGDGAFQLSGYQVWRTDGTAGGTAEIADVRGATSSSPGGFTVLPDGRAVFSVSGSNGGLWATGGTAASTGPISTVFPVNGFTTATVPDLDPLFDSDYYYAHNPDVAASGLNAYQHFISYGAAEGRNPDAYFDTNFYLTQNPDVQASRINPLTHYEKYGAAEGRVPSLLFSGTAYDAAYRDAKAAGINPLQHYLEYGRNEGRMTFLSGGSAPADPLIDPVYLDKQYGATLIPSGLPAQQQAAASYLNGGFLTGGGVNPDALFDTGYYKGNNLDVFTSGINALTHYELYGWHEGRDPSAAFSTTKYLAANPDVKAAGIDPLLHYVEYGKAEGRAIYPGLPYNPGY